MLKLSGFGDEIAADFETQLAEMRKMGLNYIALRNLWGTNVLSLDAKQRDRARKLLRKHGMGISEIGSPLGKVLITGDWKEEWARYETAIELTKFFGCPRIRIFSYYFPEGEPRERWRGEVIRRLREMSARAEKEGVVLLHENDTETYGEDGLHCRDLVQSVGSKAFVPIFDPANFVRAGGRPYTQWWDMLAADVGHLHVKDCKRDGTHVPAGQGDGEFKKVLQGLKKKNYVGFATMEPHLDVAGQFSGFSGPDLFAHAVDEFRKLCDSVGMPHRQTRVAVVGMGFIGGFHCKALADVPEAHLAAVADAVKSPGLKATSDACNVEPYTDLDALLARDDIDAITIGTPSGLHGEIAIKAMDAGKHVLTEKPIEITLARADAMIAAAKKNKVKLGVISQHRTDPGIIELRDAIHSGALGKIVLAEAYVKWYRSQEYYDSGGWRGTWKLDGGGALMNQGVHTVDMLQWVMDSEIESVVAQTATAAHSRIEVEDIAQALLRFKNGALGMIVATTAAYPGMPERLEVTGTKGTIIVEKERVTMREIIGEKKKAEAGESSDYGVGAADPKAISNRGHVMQLRDFVKAIQDDRDPLVPGNEGRKPLEIILAIYESAKTGKRVKLPLRARK